MDQFGSECDTVKKVVGKGLPTVAIGYGALMTCNPVVFVAESGLQATAATKKINFHFPD